MLAPIVPREAVLANPSDNFDTSHRVDARFAGGAIVADTEFVDWLGRTVIRVEIPGLTLHLYPHEARDLAAALQALAAHIDEAEEVAA